MNAIHKMGLVFAAGCALRLLSACDTLPGDRYTWLPDDSAPYCDAPLWKQVSPERIPGLCMGKDGQAADERTSCTVSCVILSPYSEEQAKHIQIDGLTLYQHEVEMHAMRRLRHPG